MTARLFICLCFMFGSVCLRAQAPVPEEKGISISLVGLGYLPSTVKIVDGSRILNVEVPASGRGQVFKYRGSSPLVFVQEIKNALGKVSLVPVANVAFAPTMSKMLVVLVSKGRSGEEWRFTAQGFDDTIAGFPAGHARVFNFYQTVLAVNSGPEIVQIEAGQSQLVPMRGSRARIWMKVAVRRPAEWEILPTFITQVAPNTRILLFAYEAPDHEGTLQRIYRSISEIAPTETLEVR